MRNEAWNEEWSPEWGVKESLEWELEKNGTEKIGKSESYAWEMQNPYLEPGTR